MGESVQLGACDLLDLMAEGVLGRPPVVLVAEENERLRRIVRVNLERERLDALEASSMAECQQKLMKDRIGLILISPQLPGFEIQAFSDWLRESFPADPIPVVILSFEPEDRLLTLPLRWAVFQQKPFDPGQLAIQLTKLMAV
jgi:two-component system, OmpR family, response regulator ResD